MRTGSCQPLVEHLVKAKEKLVELLNEQKQTIVHQAVTRGLNSEIPIKTGLKLLEKVPEHWEIMPLKRLGWFSSGAGFPISQQGRTREELFCKVSDMNLPGNEQYQHREYSIACDSQELGAYIFPKGTYHFSKSWWSITYK